MSFYKNNKPAFSVFLSVAILGTVVVLFSFSPSSEWLDKHGLKFTDYNSISDIWGKKSEPEIKETLPKHSEVTLPESVKKLDSGDKVRVDTIKARLNYLENFADKDNTCLDLFFKSLDQSKSETVHIWYYGDSQIEGDRITGELRNLLQGKFGGSGAGYVPFSDLANYRNFELFPPYNLQRLNCFINKSPKGFGFAGKTFLFKPADTGKLYFTTIKIKPWLKFNKLYLLTGAHPGGKVVVKTGDSAEEAYSIPKTESHGKILLSDHRITGPVEIGLPGTGTYSGLEFEGDHGIQIDNCGIRGHSGDGLRFIRDDVIREEAVTWNTRLVIFHFGNNMIPYIKGDAASMNYYYKSFKILFQRYKKLMPEASFLVISAGDMGTVIDGEEKAYPFVGELVEATRKAAMECGFAFFDSRSLLLKDGGILGWKKKGYAGLDGHLTPSGQLKFAATLFTELMKEYDVYKILNQAP